MPDVDTLTRFITIPKAIDTEECKAVAQDEIWQWPCGMAMPQDASRSLPGALYTCFRAAHVLHHVQGHLEAPMLTETVISSPDGLSLTITVSCGCK